MEYKEKYKELRNEFYNQCILKDLELHPEAKEVTDIVLSILADYGCKLDKLTKAMELAKIKYKGGSV